MIIEYCYQRLSIEPNLFPANPKLLKLRKVPISTPFDYYIYTYKGR